MICLDPSLFNKFSFILMKISFFIQKVLFYCLKFFLKNERNLKIKNNK